MKKSQQYDKYGNPIEDEVVRDRAFLRVPLTMMDGASDKVKEIAGLLPPHQVDAFVAAVNNGATLADAVATARALKRVEQFDDARGHRPGFLPAHDAAASDAARETRDRVVGDAWRNPPAVVDQGQQRTQTPTSNLTHDELITARDKRLENAWRNG